MSIKNRYPIARVNNELIFFFTSTNSDHKNPIIKIIQYVPIERNGATYYNLGFADFDAETGLPDDKNISNNGDMRKILRTAVSTLSIFFEEHPNETVHITGSDPIRNIYYHKIITDYMNEIQKEYHIQGCSENTIEIFNTKKRYDFILISSKKSYLNLLKSTPRNYER